MSTVEEGLWVWLGVIAVFCSIFIIVDYYGDK